MKLRTQVLPLALIFAILYTPFTLLAQSDKEYFRDDFLYKDKVYRIEAKRENKLHKFTVSLDKSKQEFDLVRLEEQYLFYKKLAKAINNINSPKDEIAYGLRSSELDEALVQIQTSTDGDPAYSLDENTKKEVTTLIKELVKLKDCDSVFINRPNMQSLLDLTNSGVSVFLNGLKNNCEILLEDEAPLDDKDLLETSMGLFALVLRYSLIEPDDASLAGRIVVNKKVKVCIEGEGPPSQYKIVNGETDRFVIPVLPVNSSKEPDKSAPIEDDTEAELEELLLAEYGGIKGCDSIYHILEIDSVQFEFEADRLQNIKVLGRIDGQVELFESIYPLSFSTKRDGNDDFTLLSVRNIDGRRKKIKSNHLFFFDYNLLLYTENYAPKDQVLYIKPESSGTLLLKEKNSEILKTRVFTDLVGLGEQNPNGLLQLEFSKPISLRTKVAPWSNFSSTYTAWFHQMEPVFTFNKIEEDDSSLETLAISNSAFVSYTDVLRYRRASVGLNLTVFTLGVPSLHSTFSIKYNHHYSIVPIASQDTSNLLSSPINSPADSVMLLEQSINNHLSRELGLSLEWKLLPSDKYHFTLTYTLNRLRFFSNDQNDRITLYDTRARLLTNPTDLLKTNKNKERTYHSFELLATVKLSKRGELFFRSRYHFLGKNVNQNFFQSQLGYSYFFFANNN